MNELKIKLAAIARDEAAYLPEWIFHHLEFGFDEIEIYINNTSDNSLEILNTISETHPVVVTDANELFKSSNNNFQLQAYQTLTADAMAAGFTHIMFLDIDEFWTPVDFTTTIKEALVKLNYPQALSINWLLHCDEDNFSPCYKSTLTVCPESHVKTIFRLDNSWEKVEIHNVIGANVKHTRGDGSTYDFGDSPHCALTDTRCMSHDYFVIHRMYRSQVEYISLLGRGRANKLKLKDNRNGYYAKAPHFETMSFEPELLASYYQRFDDFKEQCQLNGLLGDSQDFVIERYKKVLRWAKQSSVKDAAIFTKLFNRIDLPEIVALRKSLADKIELSSIDVSALSAPPYSYLLLLLIAKLLNRLGFNFIAKKMFFRASKLMPVLSSSNLVSSTENALKKVNYPVNKYADVYREMAVQLYKKNELSLACSFITKAKESRPNGPHIIKLYDLYMSEKKTSK